MPTAWPASPEQLREPRGLVAGEDDPRLLAQPVLDAVDEALRPARREDGLAPAEQVAAGQALRGERHALGLAGLGLPGELERPRAVEAALPVARRQVGGRPVLRQVAGLDHLRVPLLGLAPQEVGGVGEVAGLVEDEEGRRVEVVEAGRRRDEARPDLGGVAGGQRTGPRRTLAPGRGVAGEAREVLARAARAGGPPAGRAAAGSRRRRRAAAGTRSRAGGRARATAPTLRWSVGSKARRESISSPNNSIRTGSGADGGNTSTMPPRRANSPRPATSSTGA